MLKRFSVLILAIIQILFCIGLTLCRPAQEWLIENKGTVYNLKVNSISFDDEIGLNTHLIYCIECDWQGLDNNPYYNIMEGEYAVIKTDENGLSHFASRTDRKPKGDDYVKGQFLTRHLTWWGENLTSERRKALMELGIYPHSDFLGYEKYGGSHNIAVKVRVYKGLYRIDGLTVDGVPIEEVIA